MSSLNSQSRSLSAPQPFTSSSARQRSSGRDVHDGGVHSSYGGYGREDSLRRVYSSPLEVVIEDQDAFNLEGSFFPRSDSYFSLSSMNTIYNPEQYWVYGDKNYSIEKALSVDIGRNDHTACSSPGTSTYSLPPTPTIPRAPHNLLLSPTTSKDMDEALERDIRTEDRVGGIAYTALAVAAKVSAAPTYRGPVYEHEHMFHSYDALHSTLSEKRRAATVPDLTSLADDTTKRSAYDAQTGDGKVPFLFSPNEEKLDIWKDDGQSTEGWTELIFRGAKSLLLR
ncbi:hypothetical protein FRB99_004689 [Tulasnella sp. 403]|nr:hypothetical protein FRB99_004689 [Tulasnella sp. 403]